MDRGMATACQGKPAHAAVPGNKRSERFLTPRWGASRFGLGTQGGARDAGLPWAGMLRTVGAAPSEPENVQTPRNPFGIVRMRGNLWVRLRGA
jgi:hypothetical protein